MLFSSRLYLSSSLRRFFQPSPLFAKLEANKIAEWKRKFGSAADTSKPVTPQKPGTAKKMVADDNKKAVKADKKEKKAKNGNLFEDSAV